MPKTTYTEQEKPAKLKELRAMLAAAINQRNLIRDMYAQQKKKYDSAKENSEKTRRKLWEHINSAEADCAEFHDTFRALCKEAGDAAKEQCIMGSRLNQCKNGIAYNERNCYKAVCRIWELVRQSGYDDALPPSGDVQMPPACQEYKDMQNHEIASLAHDIREYILNSEMDDLRQKAWLAELAAVCIKIFRTGCSEIGIADLKYIAGKAEANAQNASRPTSQSA